MIMGDTSHIFMFTYYALSGLILLR